MATDDASREIQIGDHASLTRRITDADVRTFAEISGDDNPVHLDEDYAATTVFGRRIAHGALTAALVSAVLGKRLPGPGTIFLSQTSNFKAPVYVGDEVTARVEVTAYRPDKRITTLKAEVFNAEGKLVLEGQAVVLAPVRAG